MSESQFDVRVGQTVQWFVSVKAATPFAAIVLQVNPGGMLSVLSYDENGFPTRRQNVWHRGDKALKDSPQLGTRFGCWDFVFPEQEETTVESADAESGRTRKPLVKKNLEPVA